MAAGAVVYLVFAYTPVLDPIADWFSPIGNAILPLFMFLILFVTFCKVDFQTLIPVKWHLWACSRWYLFFAVVLLILVFGLRGESPFSWRLFWLALSDPAAAAPVVTAKLGGNLEQMTTSSLSNFITAILIPTAFPNDRKRGRFFFRSLS